MALWYKFPSFPSVLSWYLYHSFFRLIPADSPEDVLPVLLALKDGDLQVPVWSDLGSSSYHVFLQYGPWYLPHHPHRQHRLLHGLRQKNPLRSQKYV